MIKDHPLNHSNYFQSVFSQQVTIKNQADELNLQQIVQYKPPLDAKLNDLSVVVFDFETSGLRSSDHEVIEVGAIKYKNGKKLAVYNEVCRPHIDISWRITKITGLANPDLDDRPPFEGVMDNFMRFIHKSVLFAHNAKFDASFLTAACERRHRKIECPIYCTLRMAKELIPGVGKNSLDYLAKHFGLTFTSRHRAIGDAEMTFLLLTRMIDYDKITVGELEKWRLNQ